MPQRNLTSRTRQSACVFQFFLFALLFLHTGYCAFSSAAEPANPVKEDVSSDDIEAIEARLRDDVRKLSSDEWEGRGLGTKGINEAANFLAAEFRKLGLKTELFNGTPFQEFTVTTTSKPGAAERNHLEFVRVSEPAGDNAAPPIPLKFQTDFTPLSLGGSAMWDLPLVFAGYGISSKDDKYDDYEGIDVKEKAVIILRHEPQQNNPHGPFKGGEDSEHAPLTKKVSNAYQHGASAVVFVTDQIEIQEKIKARTKSWKDLHEQLNKAFAEFDTVPAADAAAQAAARRKLAELTDKFKAAGEKLENEFDPLLPFDRGDIADARKMPVIHVRRAAADALLKVAGQPALAELEKQIDADLKPRSRDLGDWRVRGETEVIRTEANVKNVIAVLEGEGPLAEETIIIGAHYDHLGRGESGTLLPGSQEIHNGADDNASGTTALLEVARSLAARGKLPRRIVFIAFTGEERGLLGSAHYVHQPLFPLDKTVAMLNMDMVGRLKDDELIIYGTGTAKSFDELITRLNGRHRFSIKRESGGFGPSDHASFYAMNIPVLHFFTGLHNDYHRPSDDFDKLNIGGMRRVCAMLADAAIEMATADTRPEFTVAANESLKPNPAARGSRPYFGSIPDLGSTVEGYALSGVAKDGPAEKGGLKSGDVIVGLADNKIGNLADFDSALRKFKAGETVELTIRRGSEELKLKVTLEPPRG